ncbi:MAG: hypothetical protein CMI12_04010 [Oceanospirillum sp.]|nr:hypothetical protein [Oceanospirillum sp.]
MEACLSDTAPEDEIRVVVASLCYGIESYRLFAHDWEYVAKDLTKNFPEIVLDRVLTDDDSTELLTWYLFHDQTFGGCNPLNLVDKDRLLAWCNNDQEKIQKVASILSPYTSVDRDSGPLGEAKEVILSDQIKAFLHEANDKVQIIETIFSNTQPRGWSGSLSKILKIRAKALQELLMHPDTEIREFVQQKLLLLESVIEQEREREAAENMRNEQRFE